MRLEDVFALMTLVIGVGAVALGVIAVRGIGQLRAERTARFANATDAQATIVSYESLGRGGLAMVKLKIHRPHQPAYETQVCWRVHALGEPYVQVDMRVPVKIDANDAAVIYPQIVGVEYAGKS